MNRSAFTLIELMIVIVIISFLAALTVPHLFNYKVKAYQAEVAMNLASLHTAQQTFFMEHGRYTTILNGEGGLNWKPAGYKGDGSEGNFYYTYGFNTSDGQEGVHFFTGKLKTPASFLGNTSAGDEEFTVGAAGKLKADHVDVWHIDETRKMERMRD